MGGPHHTTRSNPRLRPIPRPKLNTLGMYSFLSQGTMLPYSSFDVGSASAKTAFQEIHGAMLARVELDRCGDVFTWLKATATLRGRGGLQNVVPGVYHPLAPVHLPADVYQYMIGKVCSELPGCTRCGSSRPHCRGNLGVLAGALRALAGKAAAGG
ncbi:hypothetical protein MHU86_5064 [Fragilaria crotonensis]|nr:hypothetical protein MHU86_5064 [Fragilaria crotonensis]